MSASTGIRMLPSALSLVPAERKINAQQQLLIAYLYSQFLKLSTSVESNLGRIYKTTGICSSLAHQPSKF